MDRVVTALAALARAARRATVTEVACVTALAVLGLLAEGVDPWLAGTVAPAAGVLAIAYLVRSTR